MTGRCCRPRTAGIEVLSGPVSGSPLETDALGRFTYDRPLAGPFALRLRTGEGVLVTDWLTA
ncbi:MULTISPECIES: hypothetical protein [unclassified Streptomyces]|uniref:hypothetical protein n=1 Tax=unclassified Streptomyces TaxID=2593676 RepID=UPI000FFF223B|nr:MULTISPECIES: hypothetical protein [unclassified Streptomyces]